MPRAGLPSGPITCLALLLMLALKPTAMLGATIDTRLLQSLGEVAYHALQSEILGRTLHVFVDLPEDYGASGETYPAVYLLDGGNTFPLAAAQHHYLRFGDEAPPAILVGISYGADTFREGNFRQTDFTAPAEARDFWGGAAQFQAMLAKELLPRIERDYRADPDQRVLFGNSLGGQFVLFTALTRPDLFSGMIASSPVMRLNAPYFLAWRGAGPMPPEASRLYVSVGELEPATVSGPIERWITFWRQTVQRPWLLEFQVLGRQTHYSAVPESLRLGLQWVLPVRPAPD